MSYFDGTTGTLFEEEVLGCCTVRDRGYLTWDAALRAVLTHQPERRTTTVVALERRVQERVGLPVQLFTALRSPMDRFHGTDGFFYFKGLVVTFDLTCNPHKDCCKADLLITPDDLADLPLLGERIAREFRSKCRAKLDLLRRG